MKIKLQAPEFEIELPDGFEIDYEKSDTNNGRGNHIVLKKKEETRPWRYNEKADILGYYITSDTTIVPFDGKNTPHNHNIFATKLQAKSALAMAQISQIMANDSRFGGVVTDEEWHCNSLKYTIRRCQIDVIEYNTYYLYSFLAFHTSEQRDLFLKENEDLVKDYLMISE